MEEETPIFLVKEKGALPDPPDDDVVQGAGGVDSDLAGHGLTICETGDTSR